MFQLKEKIINVLEKKLLFSICTIALKTLLWNWKPFQQKNSSELDLKKVWRQKDQFSKPIQSVFTSKQLWDSRHCFLFVDELAEFISFLWGFVVRL